MAHGELQQHKALGPEAPAALRPILRTRSGRTLQFKGFEEPKGGEVKLPETGVEAGAAQTN